MFAHRHDEDRCWPRGRRSAKQLPPIRTAIGRRPERDSAMISKRSPGYEADLDQAHHHGGAGLVAQRPIILADTDHPSLGSLRRAERGKR